jgi:phenylalanyl-tRNA synthetase beta chain
MSVLFADVQNDRHLGKYLHIIRDAPGYPVFYDSNRDILSLPPIINSDLTKITLDTRDVLIEITVTDKTKLDISISIMVAMFSVYCSEPFESQLPPLTMLTIRIEPVQINSDHNGCTRACPNVKPHEMTAEVSYINACTGLSLGPQEISSLLEKMCIFSTPSKTNKNTLDIKIPITHADILHQCDLMEDVAIAYGYNSLPQTLFLNSTTIGAPLPINKLSDIVRKEVAFAGWTEVMSLILCSHDENYRFLRRKDDGQAVVLANPKMVEYQVVRTTLLPGILKTLRENKAMGLPVGVFEVSDVALQDTSQEHKAKNERRWAGVWINKTAGFEIVHGLLDRFLPLFSGALTCRVMQVLSVKLVSSTSTDQTWPSWLENSKLGSARSFRSESSQDSEIRAELRAAIEMLVRLARGIESRC